MANKPTLDSHRTNNCSDVNRFYDENQLRSLLDALPMLIAYIDKEQRYCFSNLAHQLWFGHSPSEIQGMTMRQVVGEAAHEVLRPFIEQVLQGQQVKFELLVPYGHIGPKYICATYVPVRREDGRIKGFFSLISDFSELRKIEETRTRHLKEAAHTARLNIMGELISQIIHQVSQPLSVIVACAEAGTRLLQGASVDAGELTDVLMEIAKETERAAQIIRRIRGFVSKHEPCFRIADINGLVRETLHLVELDPNWQIVQFSLEADLSEPRVQVDPVMIEQVILNLVQNALEAMEGLPLEQRHLGLRTQCHDHQFVEVSVEDRGTGLSPKARQHLFEPFSTTKKDGMGMGLTISRSIIERHGGRLWATDNSYGGTTFHFTLPQSHEPSHHQST